MRIQIHNFQGRRHLGRLMGAFTSIDFKKGPSAPTSFCWQQCLKGNLYPSFENTNESCTHQSKLQIALEFETPWVYCTLSKDAPVFAEFSSELPIPVLTNPRTKQTTKEQASSFLKNPPKFGNKEITSYRASLWSERTRNELFGNLWIELQHQLNWNILHHRWSVGLLHKLLHTGYIFSCLN